MGDQRAANFRKVTVTAIAAVIVAGAYYLADENPDTVGWLVVVGVLVVGIAALYWVANQVRH